MTFSPVVPFGGYSGFLFLDRTRDRQQGVMEATPAVDRNIRAFQDRIADVKTAADLVADRQLLQVALGAFGLDDDLNNKAFVQKILESDTSDRTSMASRFSDRRYRALADAFGFGNASGARTGEPGFADNILSSYTDRQFEIAAGDVDQNMRLALGFERDLAEVAEGSGSGNAKWYTVMATPPLRSVMETALGLPSSFGQLDLDRQLEEFQSRAKKMFGTADISKLAEPGTSEEIVKSFLLRSEIAQINAASLSSASAALALLQG